MQYSDIQNPKIKTIIDNLKHQPFSVMVDIQQAFDESWIEPQFIEDATANMENLLDNINEMIKELKAAGEV